MSLVGGSRNIFDIPCANTYYPGIDHYVQYLEVGSGIDKVTLQEKLMRLMVNVA